MPEDAPLPPVTPVRKLLVDAERRVALGGEAARHVAAERSLAAAAARLQAALAAL